MRTSHDIWADDVVNLSPRDVERRGRNKAPQC
jgi:hypothetical protein